MPRLKHFQDDFRTTTWMLMGAALQASLFFLPLRLALAPVVILLISRVAVFLGTRHGILPDRSLAKVNLGRRAAQLPLPDGSFAPVPGDQEVVVMVLAAQSNHIDGRFAPDVAKLGKYMENNFREAEAEREKYGFLGRTSMMWPVEQDCNNTMVWITYWRTYEDLLKFSVGPAHGKGMRWIGGIEKDRPYIGLSHEVYKVPKNHWETLYHNFRPFGLGQAKYLTDESKKNGATVSGLVNAHGPRWRTSRDRMGLT